MPFSDLYTKLLTDWSSGTNSVDAGVFAPQWMGDYVTGGFLEDISDRIAKDKALQWDDIAPFFRDFSAKYNGKTYLIPLDGDFHMIYYRTDVFAANGLKPPETWDDYVAVAKRAERQGHERRRDARLRLVHLQEAQRPSLLVHHRDRRRLHPVEGHQPGRILRHRGHEAARQQRGLRAKRSTFSRRRPNTARRTRSTSTSATPAACSPPAAARLSIDWGDIGPLAVDPATSKVIDKVGAAILPGSKEVLNRETGKLEDLHQGQLPLRH